MSGEYLAGTVTFLQKARDNRPGDKHPYKDDYGDQGICWHWFCLLDRIVLFTSPMVDSDCYNGVNRVLQMCNRIL